MRSLPDLPRVDWVEEFVVERVLGVEPTQSAPRGALRFWGRETGGRTPTPGGYHVVSFDEVVEVIGTIGAYVPRPTIQELRQQEAADQRAQRMEERRQRSEARKQKKRARRTSRKVAPIPEPEPEPVLEEEPPKHETVLERRRRKKAEKSAPKRRRRRRA